MDLKQAILDIEKATKTGDLDGALELCGAYWTARKKGGPDSREPEVYCGDSYVLTVENRIKDKFAAERN